MDQHDTPALADDTETPAEAAAINRGLADIEAGRMYRLQTVVGWLDRLERDPAAAAPDYD